MLRRDPVQLDDSADRVHTLAFDGVYRDAMVFVNDHFAAQRPSGYARFAVRLDPFLRHDGAPDVIRVVTVSPGWTWSPPMACRLVMA